MGTPQVIYAQKPLVTSVTWQHSSVSGLPAFLGLTFFSWRKLVVLYSFRVQLWQNGALRVTFLAQVY